MNTKQAHDHRQDSDCTVSAHTDCCMGCGVHHGDPCLECGQRAFHKWGCPVMRCGDCPDDLLPRERCPECGCQERRGAPPRVYSHGDPRNIGRECPGSDEEAQEVAPMTLAGGDSEHYGKCVICKEYFRISWPVQ